MMMRWVISCPDHPRSCGANHPVDAGLSVEPGSSPLVRGQLICMAPLLGPYRIIPARAGPTRTSMACSSPRKDHPRSCGANSRVLLHLAGSVGSSPLVRGQQLVARKHAFHERIIPARAGPTLPHRSHCMTVADHPRSCGANGIRGTFDTRGHGSSPLVRGQQTCGTWPRKRQRIIPARAGPTTSSDALTVFGTDHPRSCGANYSSPCTGRTGSGSSPLVRGQHSGMRSLCHPVRIIPARAGPTRFHHTKDSE